MTERVSIIMPAYNSGKYIARSIDSVLAQTYEHFELIIVNDCSTDDTLQVIQEYDDPRIVVITLNSNSGVATARNEGLKFASGNYIAFLDSDDVWKPSKLQLQVSILSKSEFSCCHSGYDRIGEDDQILTTVACKNLVSFDDMLKHNEIGNLTGMYDRDSIGKVYQKNIGHEDYLMWLDVTAMTHSVGLSMSLAGYRVRKSSLSSNKFKSIVWHYRIIRSKIGFRPFKLVYFMYCYILSTVKKRV
ncbi:glycosyltransferase family 2 protein [Citrobacter amalonaticus]|uniref:glycosyltransferase family 2 protein n=1 Tax=Citrobacter amalonaticus TaxID=35703 RepID=UPI001240ABBD|nr:glycosyltransferase family 2 protein [Citrobacter amalonaticus]